MYLYVYKFKQKKKIIHSVEISMKKRFQDAISICALVRLVDKGSSSCLVRVPPSPPPPPQELSATLCRCKNTFDATWLDTIWAGRRKAQPRGMQMCHQKPGLASECSSEWPADASCQPQAIEKSTVTQRTLCNRCRAMCLYISLCPHMCSTVDLNYKIKMFTMLCNRSGHRLLILHGEILLPSA